MSRRQAKFMTATGGFCCVISFLLFMFDMIETAYVLQIVLPLIFVVGIVLIFLSLAFYTEK